MPKKTPERTRHEVRDRILQIQEAIAQLDLVCSGTLVRRTKLCGKPGCKCARNPRDRHGPYYEWGYMKAGKQVHRMVSVQQAATLRHAIANYRRVRALLRRWEAQTVRLIDLEKRS